MEKANSPQTRSCDDQESNRSHDEGPRAHPFSNLRRWLP